MARIITYNDDAVLTLQDRLLGTDSDTGRTQNFAITNIATFLAEGAYTLPNNNVFVWGTDTEDMNTITFTDPILSGQVRYVEAINVTAFDINGLDFGPFINQLIGGSILVNPVGLPGYAIFTITGVSEDAGTQVFTLEVEFQAGTTDFRYDEGVKWSITQFEGTGTGGTGTPGQDGRGIDRIEQDTMDPGTLTFFFTDGTDETFTGLVGPPGADGPGYSDVTFNETTDTLTFVGANGAPTRVFTGVTGPQGPPGPMGLQGDPGAPGQPGGFDDPVAFGLPAGSTPTVTSSGPNTAKIFTFGIPAGADGTPGIPGGPGPAATITNQQQVTGGVNITFSDGTIVFVPQGPDGTPGVSPTITVEDAGTDITTDTRNINFVGTGVNVTADGANGVVVNIHGGTTPVGPDANARHTGETRMPVLYTGQETWNFAIVVDNGYTINSVTSTTPNVVITGNNVEYTRAAGDTSASTTTLTVNVDWTHDEDGMTGTDIVQIPATAYDVVYTLSVPNAPTAFVDNSSMTAHDPHDQHIFDGFNNQYLLINIRTSLNPVFHNRMQLVEPDEFQSSLPTEPYTTYYVFFTDNGTIEVTNIGE